MQLLRITALPDSEPYTAHVVRMPGDQGSDLKNKISIAVQKPIALIVHRAHTIENNDILDDLNIAHYSPIHVVLSNQMPSLS